MQDRFMNAKETATFLSMNLYTLYRKALRGKIPSYKMDRLRRFKVSEIEAWCEEKKAQGR